ncbi:MAG TPA: methyltransferase domain-containing protein, partial [Polyangiales bacterium]|nr:methyltransferase domain-containing protein [Polyangiales bacterium]
MRLEDSERWVFNRMADVYDARPAYPQTLIDALCALAASTGPRVLDVGAGIGHLALPLAARGLQVTAIDPAEAMLQRLRAACSARGVNVDVRHAKAEALPFDSGAFDLVVIADALHFIDSELCARELQRVLVPRGVLAVVSCELADTPFMRAVSQLVKQATGRRPRALEPAIRQLSTISRVDLRSSEVFEDHVALDFPALERLVRSVSFIGPAMNAE